MGERFRLTESTVNRETVGHSQENRGVPSRYRRAVSLLLR
jgi:hypothetical protein